VGLLHLNKSRTYEEARHGFNTWLPKVRPGGVILLHGIAVRTGDYSVWRLWEELLKKFRLLCVSGTGKVSALVQKNGASGKRTFI